MENIEPKATQQFAPKKHKGLPEEQALKRQNRWTRPRSAVRVLESENNRWGVHVGATSKEQKSRPGLLKREPLPFLELLWRVLEDAPKLLCTESRKKNCCQTAKEMRDREHPPVRGYPRYHNSPFESPEKKNRTASLRNQCQEEAGSNRRKADRGIFQGDKN